MGAVDILITVDDDCVAIESQSPDGEKILVDMNIDVLNLMPDEVLARLPDHVTIGLKMTGLDETYILRRPGLH